MKISFASPNLPKSGALILLVPETGSLTGLAAKADQRCGGQIARAMEAAGFTGRRDTTLDIVAPGGGLARVVLFGLGTPANLRPLDLEMLGGATAGVIQALKAEAASIAVDVDVAGLPPREAASLVASGVRLRVYSFTRYKSKKPEARPLKEVVVLTPDLRGAKQRFEAFEAVAEGVHLARDLVNEPSACGRWPGTASRFR
jgi:leucyl aminopeptidase